MSEREALKPCPFCGGEASSDQTGPGEYDVSCFECTAGTIACGPRAEDRASAIAAWNTRALPDREAIARIVDPGGFSGEGDYTWPMRADRRTKALAKADAILALTVGGGLG